MPRQDAAPHIVVIGAGVSGLTAAYALKQAGLRVTVLEPLPRVGGSVETVARDGFLLELGPNTYTRNDATEALVQALGLDGDYFAEPMRNHPRFLFDGKQLREVPTGPLALVSTPLLSWHAKLGILGEPFLRGQVPEEESIGNFVRRHLGPEVLRMFVAPFVSGIHAGDPEQVSMPAAFPLLHGFARENGSVLRGAIAHMRRKRNEQPAGTPRPKRQPSALCSFRHGQRQLTDALASALEGGVLCGIRELVIKPDANRTYRVSCVSAQGQVLAWEASSLVLASKAPLAAALVRGWLPDAAQALEAIPYNKLAVVHVGVPNTSLHDQPNGFGFLVPRGMGVRALGALWTSAIFPSRAPEGHSLVTLFYGGATDPGIVAEPETVLERHVREDLGKTMGWKGETALWNVTRYEQAIPSYTLGHLQRVEAIERAQTSAPAPLRFVGNYVRGIALQSCVESAVAAAKALVKQV